jgi:ABC-type antimicrobial peptide transport system permease subunit
VDSSFLSALSIDEIVINEWLANELEAQEGESIQLTYFQITPMRKLIEKKSGFTVKQVVPMIGSFADPTLMPAYPGLTEAESCSDWDSGIPIDLDRIKQRDQDYWDQYRGTPKAFISLSAAQDIWANRYGTLTAVRFPSALNTQDSIRAGLRQHLDPAQVGFVFEDVRDAATRAAAGSTDFAGLFAGLSMFLIVSAAVLLALVFAFYVESRSQQAGLLTAVGWGWSKIFFLFLTEGAVIAMAGCILGAIVSVVYTYGLVMALNTTLWTQALAGLQLNFHMSPATLTKGIAVSFLICVFAIQASLFGRIRRPVHQLLTGVFERYTGKYKRSFTAWIGWICLFAAVGIVLTDKTDRQQVAVFFTAGSLCLLGLILIAAGLLKWLRCKSSSFADSINLLAVKNIPRRTGRSLTVLPTLACGVFMVVGVGANYKDVGEQAQQRGSGTGGFGLLAETTLPINGPVDLAADPANSTPLLAEKAFVRMRLYQKDDASCLNLNRSQQPSLLGVNPDGLSARNAFSFQKAVSVEEGLSGWELLKVSLDENTIPAIGDYATVIWALGKNLDNTIPYRAENGDMINLKIVGILNDSLLQGRLLISEDQFVHHFPSVDGHSVFLIDADWQHLEVQAQSLQRKYRDAGMEVITAQQKLQQYHEVENTYLAIFLVLGGLGLILGSGGLGLVLMLNVWDRRGELAMMQAVGFRKPALTRMLFLEHSLLLTAGLFCGAVPALWAVFPSILLQGAGFPYIKISLITIAIVASGLIWIRLAVQRALKPDFLNMLRNE